MDSLTFYKISPEDLEKEEEFGKKLILIRPFLIKNKDEFYVKLESFLLNVAKNLDTFAIYRTIRSLENSNCGSLSLKAAQWVYCTMIEIYWVMFNRENIPLIEKLNASVFLMRSDLAIVKKNMILNALINLARTQGPNLELDLQAILADTLMMNNLEEAKQAGETLLQNLRRRQAEEEFKFERKIRVMTTPFEDSQNVHDSSINESAKQFIRELAKDLHQKEFKYDILNREPYEIILEIREIMPKNPKIESSLNRIQVDTAYFCSDVKFRLKEILQRIWNRIQNLLKEEDRKEAILRLEQELIEMSGLCSTGHMGRLVNVLSGFDIEGKTVHVVKISWKDQIKANIYARIISRMKEAENCDDILSAITETGEARKIYIDFLDKIKPSLYEELEKEFVPCFDKEFTKEKFEEYFKMYFECHYM